MKKFSIDKLIGFIVASLAATAVIIFITDIKNTNTVKQEIVVDLTEAFNESNQENINLEDVHASIEILDEGYDIYTCNGYGYRYGPSIIYYEDGSLDLWVSSPGNNSSQWDYIRYMHSGDGINWSDEEVVLTPTRNSLDHYSVCDPGVICFNGYYYLGYTSTTDSQGYDNSIFVARSENPDGPFEKWNGNGWGGDPVPIIEFDEGDAYWGAGEISFCIKEDTLYCYYSWIGAEGSLTKVSTADLSENWPSTLEFRGVAFEKGSGEDSCDVVYVEKYDKFLSISIEKRFTEDACVAVYESEDGFKFEKVDSVSDNVFDYCHNVGISKKENGCINIDDSLYIGYGYGNYGWGKWSARIQPIKLKAKFVQ